VNSWSRREQLVQKRTADPGENGWPRREQLVQQISADPGEDGWSSIENSWFRRDQLDK
jgi:hypothetical protein